MNNSLLDSASLLWKHAFGDTQEWIDEYFHNFVDDESTVFEFDSDGNIIGMAFCPSFFSSSGLRVGYLYALAVDYKCRNKGLARKMINKIFETKGFDVVVTIPYPHSLQKWYSDKFGFSLATRKVDILNNLPMDLGTGNKEDDIFMVRVLNKDSYLTTYKKLNPKIEVKDIDEMKSEEIYRFFPLDL